MTNRFRVSGTLARRLEELRVSPDAMFRHAGLPLGCFSMNKIFLTTEEMFACMVRSTKSAAIPG